MELTIGPLTESEFSGIRDEWNQLLQRSQVDNVFLTWEWIHTWWSLFKQNRTLFIVAARRGSELVGIAPFYVDRPLGLGLRHLKICGDELSPDYLDIIVQREDEKEIAARMGRFLAQNALRWDVLAIDNTRTGALLADPFLAAGRYRVAQWVVNICPYVRLEGTFEEYFQSRLYAGLKRFHLPKKRRTLFDSQGVSHLQAQTEPDLQFCLQELFRLHEERAKAIGRETIFVRPEIKRFHLEVSRLFMQSGMLNLQMLVAGGRGISANYGFSYGKKVYLYQSGFDPQWGKWSVGAILAQMMIEQAYQQRFLEFDFLKGTENYKALWSNAQRKECELRAYNRTLHGSLQCTASFLKTKLRQMRQAIRSPEAPMTAPMAQDVA